MSDFPPLQGLWLVLSHRQIIMLPSRHLHALPPQHRERPRHPRASGARHDHVVDGAALGYPRSTLYHDELSIVRSTHRRKRNRLIVRGKPAAVSDCKAEEINVGQLASA